MTSWISLFSASFFVDAAEAQVVLIPHGDIENDFEKFVVVAISLILLGFAAWRFLRSGR
jgi:hypothetical protein